MKIVILGGDGYLGWPTALYLSKRGHEVVIVDSFIKREWEYKVGVKPLVTLPRMEIRSAIWVQVGGKGIAWVQGDIALNSKLLYETLDFYKPDAIVHYAEQPSAPFSMMTRARAVETQANNVIGTLNLMFAMRHACPDAHIVKLGSMGEYGVPNCNIPEGWIEVPDERSESTTLSTRLPFPKSPGSFYHASKVHDSHNLEMGCRLWGMRVTDLNQGIVYGTSTEETNLADGLHTSFHYDHIFGTVLNRFLVQAALGVPLTVHGSGEQRRAFINIQDTLQCVELAILNPPAIGEFRVFNQFSDIKSILGIATLVMDMCPRQVSIEHIDNPRQESEDHYYNPESSSLYELGFSPIIFTTEVIRAMYDQVVEWIEAGNEPDREVIAPTVKWRLE